MPNTKYKWNKEATGSDNNHLRPVGIASVIPHMTTCNCMLCRRGKNFGKHIKTVTDPAARFFFNQTFEYLTEIEFDLDCFKIYLNNLKMDYPDIYRKIKRIDYQTSRASQANKTKAATNGL